MASDNAAAKALRRTDHDQRVDAFQREVAHKRAMVAAAFEEKERSIQALYFTHPFGTSAAQSPSKAPLGDPLVGGMTARGGATHRSQGSSHAPEGAATPSGSPRSPRAGLGDGLLSARTFASTCSAPLNVPETLPLLFRTEADRTPTMWVSDPLRLCVGDRVVAVPKHDIPSESERLQMAAAAAACGSRPQSPVSFPPRRGAPGTILGRAPFRDGAIVVYDEEMGGAHQEHNYAARHTTAHVPLADLMLAPRTADTDLPHAAAEEDIGATEAPSDGVHNSRASSECSEDDSAGDIDAPVSPMYIAPLIEGDGADGLTGPTAVGPQSPPCIVSPFLISDSGVPYELIAVDVSIEVTATAVTVSQVTRWAHSDDYIERRETSASQRQAVVEAVRAVLPLIPHCDLVALTADLGSSGVCESTAASALEAHTLFQAAPEAASNAAQQIIVPLGDARPSDVIMLKLVYQTTAVSVTPVGAPKAAGRWGDVDDAVQPPMLEVRFPHNFPARALSATSLFSEMSELTFVLFGVSHWGFVAESYPQLEVKRCPSFQGPRAQFTLCRKEPWGAAEWANGTDIVVRYAYHTLPTHLNNAPQPGLLFRDNLHSGFVLTEPYPGAGGRATTAAVFVIPSNEPQPEGSYFKRKLHILIDLTHFGDLDTSGAFAPRRASRSRSVVMQLSGSGAATFRSEEPLIASEREGGAASAMGRGQSIAFNEANLTASAAADPSDGDVDGSATSREELLLRRHVLFLLQQVLGQLQPGDMVSISCFAQWGSGSVILQRSDGEAVHRVGSMQQAVHASDAEAARRQSLSPTTSPRGSPTALGTSENVVRPPSEGAAGRSRSGSRVMSVALSSAVSNTATPPPAVAAKAPRTSLSVSQERPREFLGSYRGVPLSQELQRSLGAYAVPDASQLGLWCEAVIADTVALTDPLAPPSAVQRLSGAGASYADWVRKGLEQVAEHATERSYVTDVVRDVLILGFSEVSAAQQEAVAKYVNAEARSTRVHPVYCPLVSSAEASQTSVFYAALADKTKGGYVPLLCRDALSGHYLRGAVAVLPYLSPCAMVDLALQFSGPTRVDGTFTSALGVRQTIAHCVSMAGDALASDGVQMTYRLTRNRRVTKMLPSSRTAVPLSLHAANALAEASIASLLWRYVLSSSVPPPSGWLLPPVRRAAAANIPFSVEDLLASRLVSALSQGPSSRGQRGGSRGSAGGHSPHVNASLAIGDSSVSGGAFAAQSRSATDGADLLASVVLGAAATAGGEGPLGDGPVATAVCVVLRRRAGPEQIITPGSDMLPMTVANAVYGASRGVAGGDYNKPLLVKPPLARADYAATGDGRVSASAVASGSGLTGAFTIPSQQVLEARRPSPFGMTGLPPQSGDASAMSSSRVTQSCGPNDYASIICIDDGGDSSRDGHLLEWACAVVGDGARRLGRVQSDEASARYLVERLWWEAVLEAYDAYCAQLSFEQDRDLALVSGLAEVERAQGARREGLEDGEEAAWQKLLVDTEPLRVAIGRVNAAHGDLRRKLLYAEEDGRLVIEADQQRLATVAALVIASIGRMCPHGTELRTVYPHVAAGIVHGDGSTNVHYLLGVIDVFHSDASAIAFLKTASTVWSARDYSASKLLGSDGGVRKCKEMLGAYAGREDVASSVLSTVGTISSIRANFAKLSQSAVMRDVVAVMRLYPQGAATQLAAARALARLAPLDPALLPRCPEGVEALLDSFPRFCNNAPFCFDSLTVLAAVTAATPQAHALIADAGLPMIGAVLLRRYPNDGDLFRLYLDVSSVVAASQQLRAAMVSDRWVPRVAVHVLTSEAFGIGVKHRALGALRKLAGNVMEASSVHMGVSVCPILKECAVSADDEQLRSEMRLLRRRLMLKKDSMSIRSDGSYVPVPKTTMDRYAKVLPRSLASMLVPYDAIRMATSPLQSSLRPDTASADLIYCVEAACTYRCPSSGMESPAEARSFSFLGLSQYVLPPSPTTERSAPTAAGEAAVPSSVSPSAMAVHQGGDAARTERIVRGLYATAMAMLLADAQSSDNPPLPFLRRCLGIAIGEDGSDKVFTALFEPLPPRRYLPLCAMARSLRKAAAPLRRRLQEDSSARSDAKRGERGVDGRGRPMHTAPYIFTASLIGFPMFHFLAIAEALFEALTIMRNLSIAHRGLSFGEILSTPFAADKEVMAADTCFAVAVRVRAAGEAGDGASSEEDSDAEEEEEAGGEEEEEKAAGTVNESLPYNVDPLSGRITPLESSAASSRDTILFPIPRFVCRGDGHEGCGILTAASAQSPLPPASSPPPPSAPPITVMLPTVSFASEALLSEVEEHLPSFGEQCFAGMDAMAAMRSRCGLMGGDGHDADEVSVRVVLLNLLAYGSSAAVSNETFELFMEVERERMAMAGRADGGGGRSHFASRPCLSPSVLQVFWLLQKLPPSLRDLIFAVSPTPASSPRGGVRRSALFRSSASTVWGELARLRRNMLPTNE